MSARNTKAAPTDRSSQSGQNERSADRSPTNLHRSPTRDNPRTRPEADRLYAELRARMTADPACPHCGEPVELASERRLVACSNCGGRALPDVCREMGRLVRALGERYEVADWTRGRITIRVTGDADPIARIVLAEREATLAPRSTRLANMLSRFDLAIREGEVAA